MEDRLHNSADNFVVFKISEIGPLMLKHFA